MPQKAAVEKPQNFLSGSCVDLVKCSLRQLDTVPHLTLIGEKYYKGQYPESLSTLPLTASSNLALPLTIKMPAPVLLPAMLL